MALRHAFGVVALTMLLLLCTPDLVASRSLPQFNADYTVVPRPGKSWLIFTTPLNFADARKRCLREGADLVSTSSLAENQELNSAARGAGTGDFWVGLVSKTGLRTTNMADWMWLSTEQTPDFDGWTKMNPSPDNFEGKQGLIARVNPDGGWDDESSDALLGFVCQRDYQVVRRPGKSWLIFTTPLSFAGAHKRCLREGADLVTVSSPAENRDLNNAAKLAGVGPDGFWIGLVSGTGLRTANRAEWMWRSTEQTPTFDGWTKINSVSQPDNTIGVQGLTARMQTVDGGWDDYESTGLLGFVCSRTD